MIKTVIVEDDLMVASINKQFALKTPGMQIAAVFHNGREALDYIRTAGADLILLDMYMPGFTGLDLLAALRAENIAADVIMITAANDMAHIQKALTLGVVDYLIKPFQYERFSEAIERFLMKRKLINSNVSFTQEEIDRLVELRRPAARHDEEELQKGIQKLTLDTVRHCLKQHAGTFLASEVIAGETGLSKVTARRYLNYLTDIREAESRVDYSTGGRPSITYRVVRRKPQG